MNSLSRFGVTSYGTILGAVAGAASNWFQNNSLFEKDMIDCRFFNSIPFIGSINALREIEDRQIWQAGIPSNLILTTSIVSSIWNAIRNDGTPRTLSSTIKKMGRNFFKMVVTPYAKLCWSMGVLVALREVLNIDRWLNIDTSGHIAYHTASLFYLYNLLKGLSETGTPNQVQAAAFAIGSLALADIPWVYNTAANCHSIADVVSGATLGILSCLLANKVPAILGSGLKKLAAKSFTACRFLITSQVSLDKVQYALFGAAGAVLANTAGNHSFLAGSLIGGTLAAFPKQTFKAVQYLRNYDPMTKKSLYAFCGGAAASLLVPAIISSIAQKTIGS